MRRLIAVIAFVGLMVSPVAAGLITFEDLPDYSIVPDGYHGLNWRYGDGSVQGWRVVNHDYYGTNSGYHYGNVSGVMEAYNRNGYPVSFTAVSGMLTFYSLYITAGWRTGMTVLIEGLLGGPGGTVVHSTTIPSPLPIAPTRYIFNWSGIDTVRFTPSGGTNYWPDYDATDLVFDNINVGPGAAPIPGATLLLLD